MPFPITCTACRKTFSIADDVYERKVQGRVVTIKCKQCQAGIRVDGTQGPPALSTVSESVRPPEVRSAEPPQVAPASAAQVANPSAPHMGLSEMHAPKVLLAAAEVPTAVVAPAMASAGVTPTPAAKAMLPAPVPVPSVVGAKAPGALSTAKLDAGKTGPFPAQAKASSLPSTGKVAPSASTATASRATPVVGANKGALGAMGLRGSTGTTNAGAKLPALATSAKLPPQVTSAALPRPGSSPGRFGGGREPAPVAPPQPITPPPAPVLEPSPSPASLVSAPATPAAEASSSATEVLWAVDYPDGQDRELTEAEIAKELASGAIDGSALVWREGMAEWLELSQVPELRSLVAPPQPVPAARPNAPSRPGLDLPGGAAPLSPTRATAPSAPVIDFAPHAEAASPAPPPVPRQPTISGIGRVPMPPPVAPAVEPPSPPAPPSPAPAAPAAPSFPPPSYPAPAPVMVPAPALAAPFAAPIQVGRAGNAPIGASAALGREAEWPQKKSRVPLILALVVLVAIGAGLYFALHASAEDAPPAPVSALPATLPERPRQDSASPALVEPEPASTPTTSSGTRPNPGSRAALEPPGAPGSAGPNGGFAELFASGARQGDGKIGAPGGTQRFDPNQAKAALTPATFEAGKCREVGGPTGRATIVVTFDPSGKVASAIVSDPPFAGTSSGACIVNAMKRATVPPFSGLPGTVTKTISIL